MHLTLFRLRFITLLLTMVLVLGSFSVLTFADEIGENYDTEWDITLNDFDYMLHLSEETYSILLSGHTGESLLSLERLGMTSEHAQEILDGFGALMEILPESARDTTDYIIFAFDMGSYEAPGETLKEINKDPEAAEAFRQYLMENTFPSGRLPFLSDEGTVEIGWIVWDVYSALIDNEVAYRTYVTVLNNEILYMEIKYEVDKQDEVIAVMEDILGSFKPIVHMAELPTLSSDSDSGDLKFDVGIPDILIDDVQAASDYKFGNQVSYDCISRYPFFMLKEDVREALKEENLEIHEGSSSSSDELYVLRNLKDGTKWELIYEFDDKGQLVSVTMPLIVTGTAEALSGPFCAARDYYNEQLGDYETDDEEVMKLMETDPNAFMNSVVSDNNRVMLHWKDAYEEGADLYLNFDNIEGNPSVFAVYFCPNY